MLTGVVQVDAVPIVGPGRLWEGFDTIQLKNRGEMSRFRRLRRDSQVCVPKVAGELALNHLRVGGCNKLAGPRTLSDRGFSF